MGGDDLGSDDEYLAAPLKSAVDSYDSSSNNDHNDDDDEEYSVEGGPGTPRKRVVSDTLTTNSNNNAKRKRDDGNEPQQSSSLPSQPKRSKKDRKGAPLRVLGTKILEESASSQAELLSQYAGVPFSPQHMARHLPSSSNNHNRNSNSNNFMDRLLSLISKKQLKKTTAKRKSPKAIIVCLSARRCVAVLKDLAPMRLRVAKLFPKQGSVEEQAKQLETTDFGLAVGTPHRIKELMERDSLQLDGTALFGLDTFENDKSFSVYTLADTATPTQAMLKDHVHPHCCESSGSGSNKNGKKVQELKVAFV
jgi:U3-containing 90S pre-ribosomal complex subunit